MTEEIKKKQEYLKHIFYELQDYANKEYALPLELADIECELLLNYIINLQKENEDYKQRNEKAIEYIKNTTLYGFRSGKTLLTNYLNNLLNILQGGDE